MEYKDERYESLDLGAGQGFARRPMTIKQNVAATN